MKLDGMLFSYNTSLGIGKHELGIFLMIKKDTILIQPSGDANYCSLNPLTIDNAGWRATAFISNNLYINQYNTNEIFKIKSIKPNENEIMVNYSRSSITYKSGYLIFNYEDFVKQLTVKY